MSPKELVDITEGITKGFLNWTKKQIVDLVKQYKNKDISFIGNKETIELVKDQLKTSEWSVYKNYIFDKKLRLLTQMGLALRRLGASRTKLQSLRDNILSKYGLSGLHIAQFVQNGLLGIYLGNVLTKAILPSELTDSINEILFNIDKYAVFVQEKDSADRKAEEIKVRIQANLPKVFILSGYGSASSVAKQIQDILEEEVNNEYVLEKYEDKEKYICFFSRVNQ